MRGLTEKGRNLHYVQEITPAESDNDYFGEDVEDDPNKLAAPSLSQRLSAVKFAQSCENLPDSEQGLSAAHSAE